jgi:hypothetical protein
MPATRKSYEGRITKQSRFDESQIDAK